MELLGDEFFAPSQSNIIDTFLAQYTHQRNKIDEISDLINCELNGVVQLFLDGNGDRHRYHLSVSEIFKKEGAIAALNSEFWQKTLQLTDVYDCMPAKRRDEWNNQIREHKCLEYNSETVRPTMETLLSNRAQYFCERIDGIFRNLSGEHVTNSPMAFGKRMIISYMTSYYGDKSGYINDLRCVIAKFMGRDQPPHYFTNDLIKKLQSNTGVWHIVDGGALKIKLFKKGTAHLEVHPDMAWKLNGVLSSMYPNAIPSEFRTKPKKDKKYEAIDRPIPFAVLRHFHDGHCKENVFVFKYNSKHDVGFDEACKILEQIGGISSGGAYTEYEYTFDYSIKPILDTIKYSGCLPDVKSHQYYPTPIRIAEYAVKMADINSDTHTVLEPSAGQGHIADYLTGQVTCVELSKLHAKLLEAKGLNTIRGDFIELSSHLPKYDRIVMNPPFSDGRWLLHLKTAMKQLKPGGRLVAILPSSAKNHKGVIGVWGDTFNNEFDNTGVSVSVLIYDNPALT